MGWPFLFSNFKASFQEWKKFLKLKKNRIYDEYGVKQNYVELKKFIEKKQTDRRGYDDYIPKPEHENLDADGYRICTTEDFW